MNNSSNQDIDYDVRTFLSNIIGGCPSHKQKDLDKLFKQMHGDKDKIMEKIQEWWEEPAQPAQEESWEAVDKKKRIVSGGGGSGDRRDHASRGAARDSAGGRVGVRDRRAARGGREHETPAATAATPPPAPGIPTPSYADVSSSTATKSKAALKKKHPPPVVDEETATITMEAVTTATSTWTCSSMEEEDEFGSSPAASVSTTTTTTAQSSPSPSSSEGNDVEEKVTATKKRSSVATKKTKKTKKKTKTVIKKRKAVYVDDNVPKLPSLNSVNNNDNNDEMKRPYIQPRCKSSGVIYGNQDDEDENPNLFLTESASMPAHSVADYDDNPDVDDDDDDDPPSIKKRLAITKKNKNSNDKDAVVVCDKYVEGEDGDDEPPMCTAESSTAVSSNSFSCNLPGCDITFGRKGNMYVHFRNIHKSKVLLDGSCLECKIPAIRGMCTAESSTAVSSNSFSCNLPGCDITFGQKCNMYVHFRNIHKSKVLLDGSCLECKIPAIRVTNEMMPKRFKRHMSQTDYANFIERMRNHVNVDIKKGRYTEDQIAYLNQDINKNVHAFGRQLLDVVIKRGMLKPGSFDDAGGRLHKGIRLPKFSGIHQLSLDRKSNDLPHIILGESITKNLRFVALGMNTQANIVIRYGNETCDNIQEQVKAGKMATAKMLNDIVNEQLMMKCNTVNKLYKSCSSVITKETKLRIKGSDNIEITNAMNKFHDQFPDNHSLYMHALKLYRKQKGKCAVSGVIMRDKFEGGKYYQVSLDAISPKKLHVKDNLQLICLCLNCTNMEKIKSNYDANDTSGGWTTQSLYDYIGYSDNEGLSTTLYNNR